MTIHRGSMSTTTCAVDDAPISSVTCAIYVNILGVAREGQYVSATPLYTAD
jgi:hypothetical protein